MKTLISVLMVVVICFGACACGEQYPSSGSCTYGANVDPWYPPTDAEEDHKEYPLFTVVIEVCGWTVRCLDSDGNIWEFIQDDWAVGDLCNMLMYSAGETLEEQEITELYYVGHVDNVWKFVESLGW